MNPALAGIAPSIIRAINARKRPGDIDLGLGEPTLRPDHRPFEAAAAWVREHGCPYTANAGFAMGPSRVNPKTGQILDDPAQALSKADAALAIKAGFDRIRDRTPAQVVLRWSVQHGNVVLPKSVRRGVHCWKPLTASRSVGDTWSVGRPTTRCS